MELSGTEGVFEGLPRGGPYWSSWGRRFGGECEVDGLVAWACRGMFSRLSSDSIGMTTSLGSENRGFWI